MCWRLLKFHFNLVMHHSNHDKLDKSGAIIIGGTVLNFFCGKNPLLFMPVYVKKRIFDADVEKE